MNVCLFIVCFSETERVRSDEIDFIFRQRSCLLGVYVATFKNDARLPPRGGESGIDVIRYQALAYALIKRYTVRTVAAAYEVGRSVYMRTAMRAQRNRGKRISVFFRVA